MNKPRRRLPQKLLLFAGSLGICLIALELGLRVVDAGEVGRVYVWPPGLVCEFEPLPGLMPGVGPHSTFSINRDGVRGDPLPVAAAHHVLTVGGSTTECLYLDDHKAWPALLQQRLRAGGADTWVGSVGKSGRTADQHALDVELLPRQLPGVDTVLVLVGVNDLHKRLMFGSKPYSPVDIRVPFEREALLAKSFLVPERESSWRLLRTFERWRSGSAAAARTGAVVQERDGAIFAKLRRARAERRVTLDLPDLEVALHQYRINLAQIADQAARQGLRLIFMTQPTMWRSDLDERETALLWMGGIGDFLATATQEYYSVEALAEGMRRFNDELRAFGAQRSVEVVDLAALLPKDTTVFYDDVHFNERGAEQVAAAVADYLLAHPTAPAGSNPADRISTATPLTPQTLVTVEDWGPRQGPVGRAFGGRSDGACAMWIKIEGRAASTQYVEFGGTLLRTTRAENLITAAIEPEQVPELLGKAGPVEVAIVDVERRARQVVGSFALR